LHASTLGAKSLFGNSPQLRSAPFAHGFYALGLYRLEAFEQRKQMVCGEAGVPRILRILSNNLNGSEHMKFQVAVQSGTKRGVA